MHFCASWISDSGLVFVRDLNGLKDQGSIVVFEGSIVGASVHEVTCAFAWSTVVSLSVCVFRHASLFGIIFYSMGSCFLFLSP